LVWKRSEAALGRKPPDKKEAELDERTGSGEAYHRGSKHNSWVAVILPGECGGHDAQCELDPTQDKKDKEDIVVVSVTLAMHLFITKRGALDNGKSAPAADPDWGIISQKDLPAHADPGIPGLDGTVDASPR
jgi:hypothetical protein